MAFGSSDRYQGQTTMSEINVVPLVDVMLVLLIIFIITAPLLTHSVKIDLPKASSNPNTTQPEHIEFAIRDDGSYFWNGEAITLEQLAPKFTHGDVVCSHSWVGSVIKPIFVIPDLAARLMIRATCS